MISPEQVFKAYDVRGTVPDQLDADLSRAIGGAFARFVGRGQVIVARDMRESSPELSRAFIAGVLAEGATVSDIGLASTDLAYFASGKLDSPAAMFTASHNPANYNGIKMCLAGARPIGQDTGLKEIQQITGELLAESHQNGSAEKAIAQAEADGRLIYVDLVDAYASHVHSFVDLSALKELKVVADVANGMGALVVPKVFAKLPFDLTVLFPELDGHFPNHPADPIQPENLVDLQAAVVKLHADVGLAFDGDADRVFLVDEKAEPVSGSLTTALVAAAMLEKHPGATILYNLICSKVVPETIFEHGGIAVRTRVGHSFIKEVMAQTGAVFGGEHSGHYYFRDNYRADSGLIAAMVVLELMSKSGKPLSELLAPYKRYSDSGELNTRVADPAAAVEALAARFEAEGLSVDRLDGVTADGGSWWCNLRPSNTEPLLRCNVEAATPQECSARVEQVLAMVRELAS